MLTTHDSAEKAFDSLGKNADQKWFITLNLPTWMKVGSGKYAPIWKELTRPEQRKHIYKHFIKYYSHMFPKSAIVFEETRNHHIHLHACATGIFKSYGDFKDWYITLHRQSPTLRKHGNLDIGVDVRRVYNEDGLKKYLSKSPYQDKYYSFDQKNIGKFKPVKPDMFNPKKRFKEIKISNLDL